MIRHHAPACLFYPAFAARRAYRVSRLCVSVILTCFKILYCSQSKTGTVCRNVAVQGVQAMGNCCDRGFHKKDDRANVLFVSQGVSRRALLKRMAGVAGVVTLPGLLAYARNDKEHVKLAFCSQLLCVVPYEATRAAGFLADEGLDGQPGYTPRRSPAPPAPHPGRRRSPATPL